MVDADRFKQINIRFGQLTGDFELAEIAGIPKTSIRGSDAVVCYGEDEFLILLADTNATGGAKSDLSRSMAASTTGMKRAILRISGSA